MSVTRRSLQRRATVLLALITLAVLTLFLAYDGVHGDAAGLRSRTAPAILDVAAAQTALRKADESARAAPYSGPAETVGTGSGYRIQIAAASQSLARAAEGGVAGEAGLRTLQTVTGLVVAYTGLIEQADRSPAGSELRAGYLHYADSMLNRPDVGILARLQSLQTEQSEVLSAQTSLDWFTRTVWGVALLLCAALVAVLAETQLFLRRRFRRRHNVSLLSATVLLGLALAALAVFTVQTQTAKDLSHGQLTRAARQYSTGAVSETTTEVAEEVAAELGDTGWRAGLIGWVPLLGPLLGALVVRGMQPRIAEYRYRT
ncbi:hypothetical protein [Streptomyces odonnellii]|uniref:hypothetical protein n=1 Tax=Streptomyces odonnellii TaxID=1417980 RepID=UPI000626E1E9|nr:hypothetical protein [Streptomyces odonnellii]